MKRLSILFCAGLLWHGPAFAALNKKAAPPNRAAAAPKPPRLLVKFKPGMSPVQQAAAMGTRSIAMGKSIQGLDVTRIDVPPGETTESMLKRLSAEVGTTLEYVEIDHVRKSMATTNDPQLAAQTYLSIIGASTAWDTTTGSGITIAIADTGVRSVHPDLSANLVTGFNVLDDTTNVEDEEGHGTPVSGVAAAVGNNASGIAGVAFSARILPINISDDGSAFDSDIADAIVYAANRGARVVNISFSADSPGNCWGSTILNAASYMRSRGGLVTIAAGNGNFDSTCPNNPEIINVAATTDGDAKAPFSNFGADIDVSAPGVLLLSTNCDDGQCASQADGDYDDFSGTSFSAPLTAGVLALIFAIDSSFTADQAQQILFDSAKDLGAPGYDTTFGWGRVDVSRSISVAQERSALFQLNNLTNVYPYPNPWDVRKHANRQITFANLPDAATVKLFTLSGFWLKTLTASNGRATWDLRNNSGDEVAAGLYFYLVNSPTGAQVKGKVAIIK